MNTATIKWMINNSTWVNPQSETTYRFTNNKELAINGTNHQQYSVSSQNNQVLLQLGTQAKYFVKYINDFNLMLFNDREKFNITPE
jgi:hypothetical protein